MLRQDNRDELPCRVNQVTVLPQQCQGSEYFHFMSYPILQVKRFLDERHPDKYWVFNVSERPYDSSVFDGRVSAHGWADHTAPPFHLLLKLV